MSDDKKMTKREYIVSDEFLSKSPRDRQNWLSKNVDGFDGLAPAQRMKLIAGPIKPPTIRQKIADALPEMNPLKSILDPASLVKSRMGVGNGNGGGVGGFGQDMVGMTMGEMGGRALAGMIPYIGKTPPAQFVGSRLGEGVGMAASDLMRGKKMKDIPGDILGTAGMSALTHGLLRLPVKAATNPKYTDIMYGINDKSTRVMKEAKGDLPNIPKEESNKKYTMAMKKAGIPESDEKDFVHAAVEDFRSGLSVAKNKVKAKAKETLKTMRGLERTIPEALVPKEGLWHPGAASARNALRAKGMPIPKESEIREALIGGSSGEKSGIPRLREEMPSKPILHGSAWAEDLEEEAPRLEKAKPEEQAAFVGKIIRLKKYLNMLEYHPENGMKMSLPKPDKLAIDVSRKKLDVLMQKFPAGREMADAIEKSSKEDVGREWNRLIPKGRGSTYHLGSKVSPFLLYHFGIPFLQAAGMATGASSPKLGKAAVKYVPKISGGAGKTMGEVGSYLFGGADSQ